MKVSKFIVLLGGLIGVWAFFLPLLSVHDGTISGYQLINGVHEGRGPEVRGVAVAIFLPVLMLTVLGAIGLVRQTFGRTAGAASLVLGLLGLSFAAVLVSAVDGDTGVALELLLVASIAGFCGGMLAIVSPDDLATA
jgi:hypothetical protein